MIIDERACQASDKNEVQAAVLDISKALDGVWHTDLPKSKGYHILDEF